LKEKGQKWKQCNVGLSPLFLIMERSEKVLAHALFFSSRLIFSTLSIKRRDLFFAPPKSHTHTLTFQIYTSRYLEREYANSENWGKIVRFL
jgi:hypothetical protein